MPALAELLAVCRSVTVDVTLALLVMLPAAGCRIEMTAIASAPLAIVPNVHVTVPEACEQLPCDGNALLYVEPLGRLSVSVTPVALDGPALCTVSV